MSSDHSASVKSEIDALRNEMITMRTEFGILLNEVSAKMDLLMNMDRQASAASSSEPPVKKPLNKPAFFKDIFLHKQEEYLDVLYTQELIDSYKTHVDVLKKKNEADKMNKIATLIYNEHVKVQAKEKNEFERIYALHKN